MTDEEAITTMDSPAMESDLTAEAPDNPATEDATVLDGADVEPTGEAAEPGPIPYNRFKEVNDQLRELKQMKEQEASILQQFGFSNLEEMRQAAFAEQQRLEEERIASHFQQQVEEGYLDEGTAEMRRDLEIQRLQFERERAQVRDLLVQQQVSAAMASSPSAQQAPDMVMELVKSGLPPQQAAAQVAMMVDRFSMAAKSQAIRQQNVAPAPMSTSNQSAQPTRPMNPLDAWRQQAARPWREILAGSKDTV